jgi:hypothetical protein
VRVICFCSLRDSYPRQAITIPFLENRGQSEAVFIGSSD